MATYLVLITVLFIIGICIYAALRHVRKMSRVQLWLPILLREQASTATVVQCLLKRGGLSISNRWAKKIACHIKAHKQVSEDSGSVNEQSSSDSQCLLTTTG